jgi:hypothetical protein
LLQCREKISFLIEYLDTVIGPVGDEEAARGVRGEPWARQNNPFGSMMAPGLDEFSAL